MRDLDPLAGPGKDDRVLADAVAAAQHREPDRRWIAFAGNALATVDRGFLQRAPLRFRDRLTHAERGARRRIDLVPVMHLEDLDVEALRHCRSGKLQQAQRDIETDAHVRREYQRNLRRGSGDRLLLGIRESRRADDYRNPVRYTGLRMGTRALRSLHADQNVA